VVQVEDEVDIMEDEVVEIIQPILELVEVVHHLSLDTQERWR
jgi:hypothetical protein